MSEEKKYFCFCSSNCKYETMTKEQILTAIAQAVATCSVGDVDAGFITRVKEQNGGRAVTFWVGTQAQYNALESIDENCLYIITDDTLREELEKCLAEAQTAVDEAQTAVDEAQTAVDEMQRKTVQKVEYFSRFSNDIELLDFAKNTLLNRISYYERKPIQFVTTAATSLDEAVWSGEFWKISPNEGYMLINALDDAAGIRQVLGRVTTDSIAVDWYENTSAWQGKPKG